MRCEDLQNHFADYLGGSLAEPLQSEVLEHLDSCAACSEEADALQRIWASRETTSDPPDSAAMRARYDAMLNAYKQTPEFRPAGAPRRRLSLRRQVLQVLVAMTLLGIGLFAAQRTGLMVMMETFAPLTPPVEPEVQAPPAAATLPAPAVRATPARSSIEGVVLRAGSNAPIAGAQVSAFWAISPAMYDPATVPRAVTDREGRFVIDVDAGDYRLQVSAGGYVLQTYGIRISGNSTSGVPIVVSATAGRPVKDILMQLTPSGVISGRITTATGEPLLGMEVVILKVSYEEHGFRSLRAMAGPALTDDRGQYRAAGLGPGRYYVRAGSSAEVNSDMGRARIDYIGLPRPFSYGKYTTVYYPQEADLSTASTVEVQEGVEKAGLNFVLARQSGLRRVRGWIVDPKGEFLPPKTSVRLTPYADYVTAIGGGAEIGPDGKFDIHDVIPGTYWLTTVFPPIRLTPELQQLLSAPGVVDYSAVPMQPRGSTVITVGNSNIDDAVVTLARDLFVTGRIRVDGGAPATSVGLENIKVEFLSTSVSGVGRNFASGKVAPDGTFSYTHIGPSEYLIWVSGLPPDAYLKEGRLGDIDVLSETVRITGPVSEPLTFVLGAKGGQINGTLTAARGGLVVGKQVTLVPAQPTKRRDLYKTATTDRNGRFTIRGIAPGDYKLYAWETLEAFRYFDPDYVKQFETAGTAVRIEENAVVTAGVRLIP